MVRNAKGFSELINSSTAHNRSKKITIDQKTMSTPELLASFQADLLASIKAELLAFTKSIDASLDNKLTALKNDVAEFDVTLKALQNTVSTKLDNLEKKMEIVHHELGALAEGVLRQEVRRRKGNDYARSFVVNLAVPKVHNNDEKHTDNAMQHVGNGTKLLTTVTVG